VARVDECCLCEWTGPEASHPRELANDLVVLGHYELLIEVVPHQIKTVKCSMRKLNQVVSNDQYFRPKLQFQMNTTL